MKKDFMKWMKTFVAVFVTLSVCSCKDPYVDFEYTLRCSSDMLEYITPEVTYKGNDGNSVTFSIGESEWRESQNNKVSVTNVYNGDTIKYKEWKKSIHYGDFGVVEDELTIKYKLKDGVTADMLPRKFTLSHNLSASITMRDDDDNIHAMSVTSSAFVNGGGSSILDQVEYLGFRVVNTGQIEKKVYKEN